MFFNSEIEPILKKSLDRFTVFPIKYPDIWDLYNKSLANFWTAEEIDLSKDYEDWENLTKNEQFFIKNTLAFFSSSDGVVSENLVLNFYNDVQIPEARQLYAVQICIEAIHSQTYALLLDSYVKDPIEKSNLFHAIENIPAVGEKAKWAMKWISNGTFPQKLIAFAAVEGLFFSSSFASIFWLKSRGIMRGLTFSNELISRDESIHCDTAILLYSKIIQKLDYKEIHEIFEDAVKIEKKFATESLPVSLIGMNSKLMCQYIEFVCDYYLTELGCSNFFEQKISSYVKAGVGVNPEKMQFSIEEDF